MKNFTAISRAYKQVK